MEVDWMIDVASLVDLSDELIRRYSEDCEMKGISPDTLRRYLSSIKIFNQYIKTKGVDFLGVNKDLLRDFLGYLMKDRQVSPKTIENYFTSIASFYDYLEYEDMIEKNPIPAIRKRYIRSYKETDEARCGS